MSKKTTLLELINLLYQQERALIASLSDEQRAAQGQPDHWSVKDILIHISNWIERLACNLQAAAQGQPTIDYSNYEEMNAQDFEIHRQDTWEQTEAFLEKAHQAITAELQALDEASLLLDDLLSGDKPRPAWQRIVGNAVIHPMQHIAEVYTGWGEGLLATQLVELVSDKLLELDDNPAWQGVTFYNQACFHALAGHVGQALRLLKQALALNPALVEWSKEDSDLKSLRGEPAYQALYETAA
ncbi:MAG: ClbS/DfsB family four-helix bundle protein [Anaerolineales bacterium]|nr:ClbS/DfsB family four-helix bundle protein [Anaerolineales bacterium]